uniref:Uncharacterized protein n=1 Tax=Myotis myotis TaxID=51298 RepID=A0A7J7XZQ4_MYOMY|nr:hypothetical protein mMyoMyo1_011406 [Myotis myotis]
MAAAPKMEDPGQDGRHSPSPPQRELSPGSRGQSGCRGSSRSTSSSPDRKSTSSVSSPGALAIASSSISSGEGTRSAPPPPLPRGSGPGAVGGWRPAPGSHRGLGSRCPRPPAAWSGCASWGPAAGPGRPRDDSPFHQPSGPLNTVPHVVTQT